MTGWFSLATGIPCEWVRAASAVKALMIPSKCFTDLCLSHPGWLMGLESSPALAELFMLIAALLKESQLPLAAAKQISLELIGQATLETEEDLTEGVNADAGESIITRLKSPNGRVVMVPRELLETLLGTIAQASGQQLALRDPASTSAEPPQPQTASRPCAASAEGGSEGSRR